MVGAFTITEINYLVVSLFCDLVRPFFFIYVCGIKFFGCVICLVSGTTRKAAMVFAKSFIIF